MPVASTSQGGQGSAAVYAPSVLDGATLAEQDQFLAGLPARVRLVNRLLWATSASSDRRVGAMDEHRHHLGEEPDSADAMAEMLDLGAEVLHAYSSDAISWVCDLAADLPCQRILDLGSGTGTATIALARRFPGAEVLAMDSSGELLDRVRTKARDLGVAAQVATLQVDLDGPWPTVDPADLVWASMSLHHLSDPVRVLADVLGSIRPGGLFAMAEMDAPTRFLPDDIGLGLPGLEARCLSAIAESHAHQLPHLGSDWGQRLSHVGFVAVTKRTFDIDLCPPLPSSTARYAQVLLRRLGAQLDGVISADDQTTLDALIDSDGPHSVLRRQDLGVRGTRTLWAGTRPP
jgi:SAM-dependent methyltransferase